MMARHCLTNRVADLDPGAISPSPAIRTEQLRGSREADGQDIAIEGSRNPKGIQTKPAPLRRSAHRAVRKYHDGMAALHSISDSLVKRPARRSTG